MLKITKIKLEVINKYGHSYWKKFRESYRYAKERCCNSNCKDFEHYKGLWGFKDTIEYYETTFSAFLKGASEYGVGNLSIDRIDSSKPYQPHNVRFIPMKLNLRNKSCVHSVMLTNDMTTEVVVFPSFFSISLEGKDTRFSTSGVFSAFKKSRKYKKYWRIELI